MSYIDNIYDAPVYHWIMFIKHNNFGYLKKEALHVYQNDNIDESEEGLNAFFNIKDQIINEFGEDESKKEQIEEDLEIALLQLDYIITKDGFKQTLYELKQAEKTTQTEDIKTIDLNHYNKEIALISKSMGGNIIDIKKTTIHQYYLAKNSINHV